MIISVECLDDHSYKFSLSGFTLSANLSRKRPNFRIFVDQNPEKSSTDAENSIDVGKRDVNRPVSKRDVSIVRIRD